MHNFHDRFKEKEMTYKNCNKNHGYETIRKPRRNNKASKRNIQRRKRLTSDTTGCSASQKFYLEKCRGKSVYYTKNEAVAGAVSASRLIGACRIYKCQICGHYHLTTKIEEIADIEEVG